MGNVWAVKASAEDASSGDGWTELSSNGNGAGAAGRTQSPNCMGNSVGACDFATLGEAFPHGFGLEITNPNNGRSGTFYLTDVGNGSSFGPAIGLTPAVQGALGLSGGEFIVHISRSDGQDLAIVPGFGTLIGGSNPQPTILNTDQSVGDLDPSQQIRDIADQCSIHGSRTWNHANVIDDLVRNTRYITEGGPVF